MDSAQLNTVYTVMFLICDIIITDHLFCHLLPFSRTKCHHLLEVLRWWSATSPSILMPHLNLTPGKEERWTTRCWEKSSRSSSTRWQCSETSLLRWHGTQTINLRPRQRKHSTSRVFNNPGHQDVHRELLSTTGTSNCGQLRSVSTVSWSGGSCLWHRWTASAGALGWWFGYLSRFVTLRVSWHSKKQCLLNYSHITYTHLFLFSWTGCLKPLIMHIARSYRTSRRCFSSRRAEEVSVNVCSTYTQR